MFPRRLLNLMILKWAFSPSSASRFLNRPQVDLRARQECLDADVDGESALHPRDDRALDGLFVVVGVADLVPDLEALGLFFGKHELAVFVLDFFDKNFDLDPRRRW